MEPLTTLPSAVQTTADLVADAGQIVRITGTAYSPARRVERMLCEVTTVDRQAGAVKVWPLDAVDDDDVTGGKYWFRMAEIEAVELVLPGNGNTSWEMVARNPIGWLERMSCSGIVAKLDWNDSLASHLGVAPVPFQKADDPKSSIEPRRHYS